MMGRYPHFTGQAEAKDLQACEAAMRYFDVWALNNRSYTSLSGGEQQRVHFARVMAQIWYPQEGQHRYLLLDEPLTFLDVQYQYRFMQQLMALTQEQHLVVIGVLHDLNLAARFADHLLLITEGKLLAQGLVSEVLTTDHIRQAYQMTPEIIQHGERSYILF